MSRAVRVPPVRGGPDSGSATVWVLVAVLVLAVAAAAVVLTAAAAVVQRRADVSADAAALAAATTRLDASPAGVPPSGGAACVAAGAAAQRNQAALVACHVVGDTVLVEVSVGGLVWPPGRRVFSSARAGPTDTVSDESGRSGPTPVAGASHPP